MKLGEMFDEVERISIVLKLTKKQTKALQIWVADMIDGNLALAQTQFKKEND